MRSPGLTRPLSPGRPGRAASSSERGAMQARTPHAWPGLYARAAFLGGLTGAMACPLPICRRGRWPSCRWRHRRAGASVVSRVIAGRAGSPDRALPKLAKAYGAVDWATAQAYSERGSAWRAIWPRRFACPRAICMSLYSPPPSRSVVQRATARHRRPRLRCPTPGRTQGDDPCLVLVCKSCSSFWSSP
jgi:hypothetical protein